MEISIVLDKLQSQDYNPVQDNFAKKLSSVQMQLINAVTVVQASTNSSNSCPSVHSEP